jgi:hypothetical protein
MKKIRKQFLGILFITAICTSCSIDVFNRVNGNRNVITKERKPQDNFTGIQVSTGIDLYIRQGNANSITVEADENLHDIIITEIVDGKLKIYTEKNIWKSAAKKVYLTVNTIEELTASSGSIVVSENVLKATNLDVSSSSGANLTIEVAATNLISSTSSGSSSQIEANTTSVISTSSSGSSLNLSGETTSHETSASSGSSITAYKLISKDVIAKVSSGASISVYASSSIDGKASSGGGISFEGSPKKVTKKTSSGGRVSPK